MDGKKKNEAAIGADVKLVKKLFRSHSLTAENILESSS